MAYEQGFAAAHKCRAKGKILHLYTSNRDVTILVKYSQTDANQ